MKKFAMFVSGLLCGSVLMCGTPVLASEAQAVTSVVVDGIPFDGGVITQDGVIYVPMEAFAKVMGKNVTYDVASGTAYVSTPVMAAAQPAVPLPVSTQMPAQATGSYSRTNPAPLNTMQTISIDNYSEKYTANVRVISATRGASAWQTLEDVNSYWNEEPEGGYEYILAYVAVSITSVDGDGAIDVSGNDFDCYNATNVMYDSPFIVEPEPQLSTSVFAGGDTEGYVAFQVKTDDPAPKVVYGADYDGSGGIWFALQ